ncbi:MAG TPA: S8 family peptidase [Oscillatoriaceae cyanobacterium]
MLVVSLAAGCGTSPTAPTTPSTSNDNTNAPAAAPMAPAAGAPADATAPAAGAPAAAAAPAAGTPTYTTQSVSNSDGVIIHYKSGTEHVQSVGGATAHTMALSNTYVYRAKSASERAAILAAALKNPNVAYAEPDHIYHVTSAPNDPDYSQQWDLPAIQMEQAWGITKGSSTIVIASVDTGVDYNHADLAGQIIKGPDLVNNDSDPLDDNGHGTHTTGTMVALMNNGTGVAGIAPGCKVLAIKAMDSQGAGDTSNISNGVIYAADHGAKVINLSLGGTYDDQTLRSAIQHATQKGVVVVAACGNDGNSQVNYPAGDPGVIAVGATDNTGGRAFYSNYGSYVPIAAPGSSILSTWDDGAYKTEDGTSMASPHVAAAAALVLSEHPSWTPDQVKQALVSTGDSTTGFSNGTVRLNIYKALQYGGGSSSTSSPAPTQSTAPAPTPTPAPVQTPAPVKTPAPTVAAPTLSGPWQSNATSSQVTLNWQTNVPTDAQVVISSLNWATPVFPQMGTRHAVTISGLRRATAYRYYVISRNSAGARAVSSVRYFWTAAY